MKKLIISLSLMLAAAVTMAQAPGTFNYQAVVRGSDGVLVQNSSVSLRFSVLQGTATGTEVYVETHSANTNSHGLVNVEIGGGITVSGDFSTIDWANGPYFLKVEMDVNGGTSYVEMTTQQLLSVPYALHAGTVENSDNDESNELQTLSKSGSTVSLSDGGGNVALEDDDSTNELQTLSVSGSDLTLSDGGGTVSLNDADADASNELQTLSKSGSTITLSDGGGNVSLNDDDATNELQTVSKSGSTVTVSNSGGSFSVDDADADPTNELQTLGTTSTQLTLTDGGAVDLDDLNVWKTATPGIHYDTFVGIGTSAPRSELVVASDSVILTLGNAGTVFNSPSSGILRFSEAVDNATTFCGFQYNLNGSNNTLYLEGGCPAPDSIMAINRTGYMTIGGGLPLSNVTLNVMNSRQTGFRVSSNSTTLNGIVNELTSSSTSSDIFGIQNVVLASSSTSNYLYGTYNEMGGTSSAEIYASYGLSSNSGAGASVGNVALAYNYGATEGITVGGLGFAFDQQSGSSTDRITYGLWGLGNSNNSTGTSVIYGVYGSVSGSYDVGYAGYFGGDVYTTGSYLPSDVTLKSNITPVSSSLDRIMALNVYSYNYMTSAYPRMNLPEGTQFGFLAQEMQQLFPELTKTAVQPGMSELEIRQMQKSGQEVPENASESKTFTAVNYAGLVPHLTKAIQEQQVMIQQLEDQLAEKESTQSQQMEQQNQEIALLKAQIETLVKTLEAIQVQLTQLQEQQQ